LIGAILLLATVAAGTVASFKLLLSAGDLVNEVSYPSIAQATLGRCESSILFGSVHEFL
jgi:hypothetical protein